MPQTTPFHPRLEPLNQTGVWKNWSGYLVAPRYQYSVSSEYYAIRNAATLLDTSPLFKYRFSGSEATALLQNAMARDVSRCRIGQAQYTVWCDENGFVVQDGVLLRLDENEYLLTAAEASLRYFRQIERRLGLGNIDVEDVSTHYGIVALQGPHAFSVLSQLTDQIANLRYFEVTQSSIAGKEVIISRTGFTGDLGYEIWVSAEDAVSVWDALTDAGSGYNLIPIGTTALKMARVEAGLLLMDVDFHSSRYAWVDAQRETPLELGFDWMFRRLANDGREFVGKSAIRKEMETLSSRWTTVGLEIDWHDYERVFAEAGIRPPKYEEYAESTLSIYRRGDKPWEYAGYASSFLFSSLLKKPIAIAKLPLDLAANGTEVDLEISVIRKPANVLARVTKMPFYNPLQKTQLMDRAE